MMKKIQRKNSKGKPILIKKSNSIGWKSTNVRQDYKFTQKIGTGAMGIVYKAYNRKTKQKRSIKAIRKDDPLLIE